MRKITKPPKICEHCGAVLIPAVEVSFCDRCMEKIPENVYLRVIVFWKDSGAGSAEDHEFCSWRCVFNWLRNFPYNKDRVSFITLPYIGGSGMIFKNELIHFLEALVIK